MLIKFALCMLLILNKVNKAVLRPIATANEHNLKSHLPVLSISNEDSNKASDLRSERQVVQPKWLTETDGIGMFEDKNVHVNAQNLKEAAEIRQSIQDAVNTGHYFVKSDDNNAAISAASPSLPQFMPYAPAPMHAPASAPVPVPPPAPAPAIQPTFWPMSMWAAQPLQQGFDDNTQVVDQMQAAWLEFRKMLTWYS